MEQTWSLVQPSARRREWQLRRGDEQPAVLRIPVFRAGAEGGTADGGLRIERRGRLHHDYSVLDRSGRELARLESDGRLSLDGVTAEWTRLGRGQGFGFVGAEGQTLLSARVRTGLLRSAGEVQAIGLDERQAIVAALLACYLLIRRNEQAASSAAASSAVVAS
jgi:hypothetical protein